MTKTGGPVMGRYSGSGQDPHERGEVRHLHAKETHDSSRKVPTHRKADTWERSQKDLRESMK